MYEWYNLGGVDMTFWQRCLILLVAVIGVSLIFSVIFNSLFGVSPPAYAAGVIGGLTAVPLWDVLKRVKPRK